MTIEQLRRVYKAQPFRPFIIHLVDGRTVPVRHPEFVLPAPTGDTVVVYQPDESFKVIDLLQVTDLVVGPAPAGSGASKPAGGS